VYSRPFAFDAFTGLTQSFPGGTFDGVTMARIVGFEPLEHDFFKNIAKSFPYLYSLVLSDLNPPRDQQKQESIHGMPVITFPYVRFLTVYCSHLCYVEQLLSDAFTSLPSLRELRLDYDTLTVLTNNFTNDLARVNCARVQVLGVKECIVPSENFFSYFPSLKTLEK
jgi:hypothetical protein